MASGLRGRRCWHRAAISFVTAFREGRVVVSSSPRSHATVRGLVLLSASAISTTVQTVHL